MVESSSLRHDLRDRMRPATCVCCLGSYCGALLLKSLSKFQIAASAFQSEPSWNLTPLLSLNTHLVLSLSSTFHSLARPGVSVGGALASSNRQLMSES